MMEHRRQFRDRGERVGAAMAALSSFHFPDMPRNVFRRLLI